MICRKSTRTTGCTALVQSINDVGLTITAPASEAVARYAGQSRTYDVSVSYRFK
jgi:hypothetical protein